MKKFLSLVLALVMTMSLVTVSAGAKDFSDSTKIQYKEAVDVMSAVNVISGYAEGDFRPTNTLTRGAAAKIICNLILGPTTASALVADAAPYKDVPTNSTFAGYIAYCQKEGIISGYADGTFRPANSLTGYAFMKMLLGALGYDAEVEGYTGPNWSVNVAKRALNIGLADDLNGEFNGVKAVTREEACLYAFNMLQADMVEYEKNSTVIVGNITIKDTSDAKSKRWGSSAINDGNIDGKKGGDGYVQFAEEYFNKLVKSETTDDMGRPATKWIYNVGDKETLVNDKPVVSYTTKVAECDIAKDLGISSAKKIEKAYIDGQQPGITSELVSTNKYGTINPLATTSYVGAQGRLTEVYDMDSDGYRIVEINTYLAKVDKVTAAKTDRNGHTTDATVDLTVYKGKGPSTWNFDGVKAEGFTVDQYVLVTVLPEGYNARPALNKASVESVVAAEVVAGGKLTGWTNEIGTTAATSVVAGTTYNDADKFALNWREAGSNWLVALDSYGNAIGLVKSSSSYAAVARIEWKPNTTSFGGYALADIVLADGTVQEKVTVASVNGNAANATGSQNGNFYTQGVPTSGSVSIYWNNNTEYYKHIMSYSVNADGSYNLMPLKDHATTATEDSVLDLSQATYTKGSGTIYNKTNTVVATASTVFLYINENGYSYTVYTGKDNAPSISDATMCVKYDSNGYADLVVVRKFTAASNTFVAYVTDSIVDGLYYPTNSSTLSYSKYDVYKMGALTEDNKTTVIDEYGKFAAAYATHGTGLYEFKVVEGVIDSMVSVMCDGCDICKVAWTADTYKIDRLEIKANVGDTTTLQGAVYGTSGNAIPKDFNILPETQIITATRTNGLITLAEGSKSDLVAGRKMLVNYVNPTSNIYNAKTVYVIIEDGSDVNPNPNPTETKAILTMVGSNNDFAVALTKGNTADSPDITGATVRLQKSYAKDSGYDDGILMTPAQSSSGANIYTGSVSYVAGQTYYIRAYVVTADGSAFTSNVVTVNP